MTVSAIQRRHDGSLYALDESGWFEIRNGDAVDMGGGQVVSLDGSDQLGGGSVRACAAAVVLVLVAVAVCGVFGIGKGGL